MLVKMPMDSLHPEKSSDSLTRGLEILQLLTVCGSSLGLTQLADELDLPKSTTHRLLGILRGLDFIEQHPKTMRYCASAKLFALMYSWAHRFGPNSKLHQTVRDCAAECGASIYLSMLSHRTTYVISAAGLLGDTSALGSEAPVYASSVGKILVASLPPEEWPAYAPNAQDFQGTPQTNLDPEHFYEELRVAKKAGVAWNISEWIGGSVSVAAAVKELSPEPRLAVAIVLPVKNFSPQDSPQMARQIKHVAQKISAILRLRTEEPVNA